MEQNTELSQRILQAARRLFFERGFAKTQLRTIASEAGTSESGIMRTYGGKILLLRAVCESCWAEVNAHVDRSLQEATTLDDDPRNLLLELMRSVLEFALAEKAMMTFLFTHYASPEAVAYIPDRLPGTDPGVSTGGYGREFHAYLNRIERLCAAVLEVNPRFAAAGVTLKAMPHFVQSAVYGIQAGWYIFDQEQAPESDKVSIDEGVACLRTLLYQNAASPTQKGGDGTR
ncbi:MAG: TetR/AcrR family transcriptional regulator [Thermoleophilia bacterium]|nr:TetR/AcrR family transcriptional regulator [Thermoleophilia bacterium]